MAVTSDSPLVLVGVDGGVAVIDDKGQHLATAAAGKGLEERTAPTGLPSDLSRVLTVQGRLPDALWVTVSRAAEDGKKKGKTPFFRYNKGKLKQIADDWEPLVVPWSKKRILAMSTSSTRLKVKVLEPYAAKPPADQPSASILNEECAKSLKLAEAVAFGSGAVIAAGRCRMEPKGEPCYVAVRWAAGEETAVAPAPSAAPTPSADASSEAPSPEGSAAVDAPVGVPMTVSIVARDKSQHRGIAVGSDDTAYLAASTGDGGEVFEVGSGAPKNIDLPKLDGPLLAFAVTTSGERWIVTRTSAYKSTGGGAWISLPAPSAVSFTALRAAGTSVWISGAAGEGNAEHAYVYRADGPAGTPLHWGN